MGQCYEAVIDVTVNGRKFSGGEKITENMSAPSVSFMLDGGYIKPLPPQTKRTGKQEEKQTPQPKAEKADAGK